MSEDDASLDEELLQAIGGGSGTKKKSSSKVKSKKRRADSEEESSAEEDEEEDVLDDLSEEEPAKKRKSTSDNKRAPKKRREEDEEPENEEDGDEDEEDPEFEELRKYDPTTLEGDAADRKYLNSLPQVEKEQIIAERYERRKELQERYDMQQRLKQRLRGQKEDKNKASPQSRRTSTRTVGRDTAAKTKARGRALHELKKKRDQARGLESSGSSEEGELSEDAADEDVRRPKAKDRDRDADFRPADKDERKDAERAAARDEDEDEARASNTITHEDIERLRLSRDRLEQFIDKPFFDELVPGFFVRILIGSNLGKAVYRVGEIVAVKDGPKVYKLAPPVGANVPKGKAKETSKILVLSHGKAEQQFRMEYVSNSPFTPSEFNKYISEMKRVGKSIMARDEVSAKFKQLRDAHNYRFTDEDIEQIVQQKVKAGKAPVNIASQKARLFSLREAAKDEDPDEYQRLTEELERLDELARVIKEKSGANNSGVANINEKNRNQNFTTSLTTTNKKADGIGSSDLDPFSRRRTQPKLMVKSSSMPTEDSAPKLDGNVIDSSNGNSTHTGTNGTPTPTSKAPLTTPSRLLPSSSATPSKFQAPDIDIDIDISLGGGHSTGATPKVPKAPRAAAPVAETPSPASERKATMSLLDYKRRRANL